MTETESKTISEGAKGCCAPAAGPREAVRESLPQVQAGSLTPDSADFVELPGGEFLMGTAYAEGFPADGEGPVRRTSIKPFSMDRHPVTNARFAAFVEATGYKTEAEIYGWSFVFHTHIPAALRGSLVADTVASAPWWCKVPGATWRAPEGPQSAVTDRADHPVVHASWNDAQAFCAWVGARLPTEAEWEYAARGGLEQKLYPWGDKLRPEGKHRCNIWQGEFPYSDTADDGYAGTCPVTAFAPNGFGLYSVTGNAWEWCHDWFAIPGASEEPAHDPAGPLSGQARVTKGGSFLCHKSYCNRYRVAARSSNTPDSSTANLGFRCAR